MGMMRKIKNIVLLLTTLVVEISFVSGQDPLNENIIRYIETYAPTAIKEMNRTGVPAAIKIAQGILETNAGQSDLVLSSNNHFGIKCKLSWTGEKVYHDDDAPGECFRKYPSAEDSYLDHSDYLKSQPRYSFLFDYDPDDYSAWAWGLKKAGYATNPVYAESLIKFIETYRLTDLHEYLDEDQEDLDLSEYLDALRNSATLPPLTRENNGPRENDASSSPVKNVKKTNAYPSGIFRHEGTKAIYAEKGTSLLALAKKHKKQLSVLISYNKLPSSTTNLLKDQIVYLERKKKLKTYTTHTVRKGESLYTISRKFKTTIEALKKENKLKNNDLQPGQKLKIKKTA
jgi:LysM repeat protein